VSTRGRVGTRSPLSLAWWLVTALVLGATFLVLYHYLGRWSLIPTVAAAALLLAINVPREDSP